MNVVMRVKNKCESDNHSWTEEFNSETVRCLSEAPYGLEPTDYAELVVGYFNDTLKPGEKERMVLSACMVR